MIQGISCVFKIPLTFWGKMHGIVSLRHREILFLWLFWTSEPGGYKSIKIWLTESRFLSTQEAEKILTNIDS